MRLQISRVSAEENGRRESDQEHQRDWIQTNEREQGCVGARNMENIGGDQVGSEPGELED
jgi:hypothetical protein